MKNKRIPINNIKINLLYIAAILVSIFCLLFFICCVWIGYEVKNQCQQAKRDYGGDCIEALINTLNDQNKSYRTRNNAIWSLGQLQDNRALPVLKKFFTGKIPPREPQDKTISQYELKKAINLVKGGTNITAIFWRYGIDN